MDFLHLETGTTPHNDHTTDEHGSAKRAAKAIFTAQTASESSHLSFRFRLSL